MPHEASRCLQRRLCRIVQRLVLIRPLLPGPIDEIDGALSEGCTAEPRDKGNRAIVREAWKAGEGEGGRSLLQELPGDSSTSSLYLQVIDRMQGRGEWEGGSWHQSGGRSLPSISAVCFDSLSSAAFLSLAKIVASPSRK